MISRRSFLAALSCLPFVGKMIPQEKPSVGGWDMGKSESVTVYTLVDEKGIIARYDFDKEAWDFCREPASDLSNITGMIEETTMTRAEWSQRYQA